MINTTAVLKGLVSIPGIFATDLSRRPRKNVLERAQMAELLLKEEILDELAMVSVSDLDGQIIYANKMFSEISGFSNSELVGQSHLMFYHKDTPESIFKEICTAMRQGNVWRGEMKLRKRDGGYYWVMNTVMPIFGPDNLPEKYISVRQDISRQKKMEEMVEEHRAKSFRDLYENVQYAGHIHRSLMPNVESIKTLFPQSFVNYIPRNVIGGDFFWFTQKGNRKYVALGDSTGHGVSASLISSLAVSNLINIVEEGRRALPSDVLKELNKRLVRMTSQNNETEVTESADTAFLEIDLENKVMTYASGKTRIVLLRKKEVIGLKKDNETVGGIHNEATGFTDHQVQLQQGDRIFLFSDGYIDQFGGRYNKKLGSKRLRTMLEKTSVFDMDTQAMLLREYILHWKGENNQTDDISMIGLEIE